jgi:cytochrome b subunit of formate dehydrogenase
MKRLVLPFLVAVCWLALAGVASAQVAAQEGWPPQTAIFNDSRLLALSTPFLIAAGILVGIVQARAAARGLGGDALLGDKVRRHDTGTIIAHWMNAFGMVSCLVTGALLLRWHERAMDLRTTFIVHYLGAALIIFAIFNHLSRHLVAGGTGLIPKSFRIIPELIGELFEYVGLFGPEGAAFRLPIPKGIRQPIARYVRALLGYKPHDSGKYLATEKILSYPPWSILIGTIVVTGVIKLAKYVYPIPLTWVSAATVIHDLATLWIGIMLIIHMLPLLTVPANWPLLMSIFRSTVPRSYVEHRHPQWYKQMLKKQPQPVEAPAPAPAAGAPAATDAASAD